MPCQPTCPHVSPSIASAVPAVPCDTCRGFVDRDLTVMDAAAARQRYPPFAQHIDAKDREWHPSRAAQAFEVSRIVGQLAKTLLAIIFALIALALVAACTVAVV